MMVHPCVDPAVALECRLRKKLNLADSMPLSVPPVVDPDASLLFVLNTASGAVDIGAKRAVIEGALAAHGRRGELRVCQPRDLPAVAAQAAAEALQRRSAMVAVGGDGSLNAVAQAAHAAGCAMGIIPYGTFNYFARTHAIPTDPVAATAALFDARLEPVQVATLNDRLFLVNASLGLYPELLRDRERFKARLGRSRPVALLAALKTVLWTRRRLRLHIETPSGERDLETLNLFLGNNRLQLQQLGADPEDTVSGSPGHGSMAAVMLRPVSTPRLLTLLLQGALGRLGQAAGVDSFEFHHIVIRPTLAHGDHQVEVAYDGEVTHMAPPIDVRVHERPLYLLTPAAGVTQPIGAGVA